MATGQAQLNKEIRVDFFLNGQSITATVAPQMTLLRYLRDELRLTGSKNGCNTGNCGSCMVLVDSVAVKSCLTRMDGLTGKKVVTIEGLAKEGKPDPVQAAFLSTGAIQCGFCTPGMVIATHSLLARCPTPNDGEIRESLKDNICRCTGYAKIIDAVRLASRWLKFPEEIETAVAGQGLGRSLPDYDGLEKVTGRLAYCDDLRPDNTLHGKIVWSAYPHAEILSVDTAEAAGVDGVHVVLTAADVPGVNGMGSLAPDQPVLCPDRVRFVGDVVAAVIAETPAAAARGARKVKVKYRQLPGVFSPQQSLQPDAFRLHPRGNICKHLVHEVGDINAGFKQAAVIVEGHFETPFVEHAYLEPETGIAFVDENGQLVVKSPTQFPFEMRKQLAAVLNLPEEAVRVIATPLGGAFGGKLDNSVEALVAIAAQRLGHPVKITLTREESLRLSTKRHAYSMDYRVGVDAAGRIVAVDAKLLSDAGPYTTLSPRVIDQACIFSCGPYRVPNLRVEGWAMFTNNANGGAFRGFGINQAAIAIESLLDECAAKLGLDKFELRWQNALTVGDRTISGQILTTSVGARATIEAARNALDQEMPAIEALRARGKRIGVGMASAFKNVGAGKGKVDDAGAILCLQPDGRILLRASAVDMGQGIRTALVQIASEALNLPEACIDIITGDTAVTIKHGGAVGERQILIAGKAVEVAAEKFKAEVLARAAAAVSIPVDELALEQSEIRRQGSKVMTLADLAARCGSIEVSHYYVAPKTYALADKEAQRTVPANEYRNYPSYAYSTQVAIVEVDMATGQVKVLKIIAAHDCGRAINPVKIEGQIEGSCLQGLGYALSESYPLQDGMPVAKLYKHLGVPTILEAPQVQTIIIEDPEPCGPFGAKGVSEVATVPVTPAILNAITDAIGIRFYDLPVTPDKVLRGLGKN
jgi:CO/xanthine dehydrogenase Mo-binding subunit/aerobic-type carbon monoxide dehydrogenase small subunit (CoxS/CutS family)